jgi:replicative DNA helicase
LTSPQFQHDFQARARGRSAASPLDRQPPQSSEAERAVLSAALCSQESLGEACQLLISEDFYAPKHRALFAAMERLLQKGEPPDAVTVAAELERFDQLELAGGPMFLAELLEFPSSAANLGYYAKIVRERARLRALIATAENAQRSAFESDAEADELLDAAQNELFQLSQRAAQRGYVPLKDLATETFQRIQDAYNSDEKYTGVRTGFKDLDDKTGGLQASDLIIIAGRPAMGKTSLALNLAYNAAQRYKTPVGVFSLEMSSEQLVMRLISSQGRLDNHKVRTGQLQASDWPRLTHVLGDLTNTPIYIDDTSGISLLELRAKARRMVQHHGVKMIVIDYMQLITVGGRIENRQQEISLISRSLKGMAKDLHVPVVALSQLSRAVESRSSGDHRPMLSDLRESGAIEQDADVVMFVYRQSVYEPENIDVANIAELIIGKQRNGPIGTVKLHFDNTFTLFSNLARQSTPREGRG